MALDGAFLSCLREELNAVLNNARNNARIEKIHQPSREELVISLRTRDGAKSCICPRAQIPSRKSD